MSTEQTQKPIDIYLIRHGKTLDNLRCVTSGGDADPKLSQEGIDGAEKANAIYKILLENSAITEKTPIVTTGRHRTNDTAKHFTGRDNFIIEDAFKERTSGKWVGILTERLYAELKDPKGKPVPDIGEDIRRHKDRIKPALEKWIDRAKKEPIIIVSHAGTTRRISSLLTNNGEIEIENAVPYHLKSVDGGKSWDIKKLALENGTIKEEAVKQQAQELHPKTKLADILKADLVIASLKLHENGSSIFTVRPDKLVYSQKKMERLADDLGELLIGRDYKEKKVVRKEGSSISVILNPTQTQILRVFSQINGIELPLEKNTAIHR